MDPTKMFLVLTMRSLIHLKYIQVLYKYLLKVYKEIQFLSLSLEMSKLHGGIRQGNQQLLCRKTGTEKGRATK